MANMDFIYEWCDSKNLNERTAAALVTFGVHTQKSLKLLTEEDVNGLKGVTLSQRAILRKVLFPTRTIHPDNRLKVPPNGTNESKKPQPREKPEPYAHVPMYDKNQVDRKNEAYRVTTVPRENKRAPTPPYQFEDTSQDSFWEDLEENSINDTTVQEIRVEVPKQPEPKKPANDLTLPAPTKSKSRPRPAMDKDKEREIRAEEPKQPEPRKPAKDPIPPPSTKPKAPPPPATDEDDEKIEALEKLIKDNLKSVLNPNQNARKNREGQNPKKDKQKIRQVLKTLFTPEDELLLKEAAQNHNGKKDMLW